jgi:hypothetical protein
MRYGFSYASAGLEGASFFKLNPKFNNNLDGNQGFVSAAGKSR